MAQGPNWVKSLLHFDDERKKREETFLEDYVFQKEIGDS